MPLVNLLSETRKAFSVHGKEKPRMQQNEELLVLRPQGVKDSRTVKDFIKILSASPKC